MPLSIGGPLQRGASGVIGVLFQDFGGLHCRHLVFSGFLNAFHMCGMFGLRGASLLRFRGAGRRPAAGLSWGACEFRPWEVRTATRRPSFRPDQGVSSHPCQRFRSPISLNMHLHIQLRRQRRTCKDARSESCYSHAFAWFSSRNHEE